MDKLIFKYNNGRADVFGDPAALMRRLVIECRGDYQARIRDAFPEPYPPEPEANAIVSRAKEALFAAVRKAFAMVPFDTTSGDGATDEEVHAALCSFLDFWVKKKMPTEWTPTSTTPSESITP